ncbi:MAG: DUF4366 domain-containing protein [Defluviitaleaceae bacterium]|nr:DUF4366 domain-containing protein [Defluviitaleaceae bacterium]
MNLTMILNNQRLKRFVKMKCLMALLLCMSLFLAPMTAFATAGTPVAPPMVEAEIIGSLLRIRATSGFYAIEAVYINERRFNHRVDSALVVDIGQYIAAGDAITVYAVDFAGNQSDTVLLTPPPPAQPPAPNNITPEGQGEILDHLTSGDGIEFITITTPTGNVFHLIIDHTRSSNNVYFLNAVTEWDLLTLAAEAELAVPIYILEPPPPPPDPIIIPHEPTPPEPTPAEPSPTPQAAEEKGGGRAGTFIFLLIAGAGAFGVIYYLKILKPKREREMYGSNEDESPKGDDFEDVDDDAVVIEAVDIKIKTDAYDVDEGKYVNEGDGAT